MAYPSDFPLAEIQNVISIIRNGQMKEKFQDLAHDIWIVQGYAQGVIIGNPDIGFSLAAQADFDGVVALEQAINTQQSDMATQIAIPWDMILAWALELLRKIFEEYGNQ
jgi:hypothetical protein